MGTPEEHDTTRGRAVQLLFTERLGGAWCILDLMALEPLACGARIVPCGGLFTVLIQTPPEVDELDDVLASWAESGEPLEFSCVPEDRFGPRWMILEAREAMLLLQTVEIPVPDA